MAIQLEEILTARQKL